MEGQLGTRLRKGLLKLFGKEGEVVPIEEKKDILGCSGYNHTCQADLIKRLITTRKTDWSPSILDSSNLENGPSFFSPYIDFIQDSKWENELTAIKIANGRVKQQLKERSNEQKDENLDL